FPFSPSSCEYAANRLPVAINRFSRAGAFTASSNPCSASLYALSATDRLASCETGTANLRTELATATSTTQAEGADGFLAAPERRNPTAIPGCSPNQALTVTGV